MAFGDLKANNVRGVFAEWMVAQLLGLQPKPRGSWDEYDILLEDGRTIEVKARAYLQVWPSKADPPSVIRFRPCTRRHPSASASEHDRSRT